MLMLISILSSPASFIRWISIHLMLMLIADAIQVADAKKHFNTSHVNVNPISPALKSSLNLYFNTSHVNVNHVFRYNLRNHS